jgi:2-phosphosulfolactate phosphatase
LKVECEWGITGARRTAEHADVAVVIDVLSFSTAVDIAVAHGILVYPYPARDEKLPEFARSVGAEVAGHRGEGRFSLSPACYLDAEPGTRVVLPSVNGGAVTEAVEAAQVLAGCLRNAGAIARAIAGAENVVIIPAGERWPDGSLRPAIEDWLGAGAVIDQLEGSLTAEADAARCTFRAVRNRLGSLLADSLSGMELADLGFAGDVALAAAHDVSGSVPVLREGAYVRAGG